MNCYSQYGEEEHLLAFFQHKRFGYVVDVGAADGQTHSNSRLLLHHYNWAGLLIEPMPEAYALLQDLYYDRPDVRLVAAAIDSVEGVKNFHVSGQVSTSRGFWKQRCEEIHGVTYQTTQVPVWPLGKLLRANGCPHPIDLLTIDAEGCDMEALLSMDWELYQPGMVIVEGGPEQYRKALPPGFRLLVETAGNSLFVREDYHV